MPQSSPHGELTRSIERSFPPEPASVPAARRFIEEMGWGNDGEMRTRLATAVSEVVTNSILHARTMFSVRVTIGDDRIRVSVRDESPEPPIRQHHESLQSIGRGLLILDEMADRWGFAQEASGKTVWFEIERGTASVDH